MIGRAPNMTRRERQRASRAAGLFVVAAMVGFLAGISGFPDVPARLLAAPDAPAGPSDGLAMAAPRDDVADAGGVESPIEDPVPVAESGIDEPLPAAGQVPVHLLRLPDSVDSALIFDLLDNHMYLYRKNGSGLTLANDAFVAVGKNGIDKQREGDEKTPVGIYYASRFIPGATIPAIYGAGAFPINYPNTWDRLLGRTGSGIWIHGTDKDGDSLLPLSSRGCLTMRNDDFLTLARHLELKHTPVVVSRQVTWASPATVQADRDSLAGAIETWRRDWESLDTERYLRHYSPSFSTSDMDLAAWSAYKRRVNSNKTFVQVELSELGLYRYPGEPELYMATFRQSYRSSNFNARRSKHQFWRRENGEWRIVHEGNP